MRDLPFIVTELDGDQHKVRHVVHQTGAYREGISISGFHNAMLKAAYKKHLKGQGLGRWLSVHLVLHEWAISARLNVKRADHYKTMGLDFSEQGDGPAIFTVVHPDLLTFFAAVGYDRKTKKLLQEFREYPTGQKNHPIFRELLALAEQ